MKKMNQIDPKYTWDLTIFYKSDNDYNKDFDEVKKLAKESLLYKGKLNNKKDILANFKLSTKMNSLLEKMEVYLMLRREKNGKDVKALEDISALEYFLADYSSMSAFEIVELSKLSDNFIDELISDPEFEDYNVDLKHLKEDKKHILDEKSESMLSKVSAFVGYNDIFTKLSDLEMKFGNITLDDGSIVELTDANYALYSHDKSQNVRKQANETMHRGYKNFNLTIAENFINFLKYCDTMSEFKNFDGELNAQLFGSRITSDVIDTLIKVVNKNLPLFYNYVKVLKDKLQLKTFYNSDIYAPVSLVVKQNYTYKDAKDIVKKALLPLGGEYNKVLNILFENRTIDVYPTENKGSGAFSTGVYKMLPHVLLNFAGTYNDISTIAHELGHSMHTYYSSKAQCFDKSGYDIFVAEIASTVNELLLFTYMEKNAKNNEERKSYIANFLQTFYATVFRQTMFTEFEVFAHGLVHQKQVLSFEKLNSEYGKLQEKYFGKDVKLLENVNVEWSRIPHFYRPFYVYKYATGLISACSIVSNIIERGEEYVNNCYMKFLSAGSSLEPLDILKLADVDMRDSKTYQKAFDLFERYLTIFSKI